ncbi:MAG: DUF6259 domain-containing protein [Planctomycetota bacterium]
MKPSVVTVAGLLFLHAAAFGQAEVKDEPTQLVVRNGKATVVLSKRDKGAIVSFTDNRTGQEFVAKQAKPCLFRLVFTEKGDVSGTVRTFSSDDAQEATYSAKSAPEQSSAVLAFSKIGGREIGAVCAVSVKEDDPLVRWRISVDGSAPLVLEGIHFPVLVMRERLGESDEDDAAVVGDSRGGIFRRPGRWTPGARFAADQPGRLTAQFACCYDAGAGLYTATQDSKGYPKTLEMVRTADGVELVWKHLCFHELSKPLALDYDIACTTFGSQDKGTPTDWRDAADIYKQWALKQPWCARTIAERNDFPESVKRGSALLFCDLRSRWGNAASMTGIAEWIERNWRRNFGATPPPTVIFFACEGLAAWASPDYFPLYPSDEAFMAGARALHKVGAHVYLAPSSYQWWQTYGKRPDGGYLWDGRAEFDKTARAHAAADRDGPAYSSNYSWLEGGDSAQLCHGDPWTRKWFSHLAEELHNRGADMFHLDQTIGGRWLRKPCYSGTHGHPPGRGLWETEAMHDQLCSLQKSLPQFSIAGFEEPQELFIQQCCLQFYDGWQPWTTAQQPGQEPAPVIEYLYHEFLPLYAHRGGVLDHPAIAAYCLVNGNFLQYRPALHGLPGEPMLRGGGFEEWNDNETPVHWQNMKVGMGQIWKYTGVVSRDANEKHGGEFSLRLEGKEGANAAIRRRIMALSKEMCVGKTYRLRVWLKSTGTVKEAVTVRAADWSHKPIGSWGIDTAQAMDWTERQIEFTMGEPALSMEIALAVTGRQATVWFDDIVLEEVTADSKTREAVWTETPQNRLYRQWAQLASGEGRPYLVMGKMLRPPQLIAEKVQCTVPQASKVSFTRRVPVHISDAQGKIFHSAYIDIGGSDVGWVKREVAFTVPEGAAQCTIYLYLQGKGKLWFDDLELVEVGKEKNLLRNGALEEWADASPAPSGWEHETDRPGYGVERTNTPHRDEKDKHGGKFALNLMNDEDGNWSQVSQTLPVGGTGLSVGKTYRLGLWLKAQGMSLWRRQTRGEIPAIFHSAFRAPDGSEAVIAVNITDQLQTGRLVWHGEEIKLELSPWEAILFRKGRVNAERKAG